jgi:hypothetical protein
MMLDITIRRQRQRVLFIYRHARQASQSAQNAIEQLFNQAGVGIDFVNGPADLTLTYRALARGVLGDDSGGSSAVVDMNQAIATNYTGAPFGVLIAHEWGHYVTGCSHFYTGANGDCGSFGLMAPGTAFGHTGLGGVPLPGNPNLPQWQFQPSQFGAIQQKCTSLHH